MEQHFRSYRTLNKYGLSKEAIKSLRLKTDPERSSRKGKTYVVVTDPGDSDTHESEEERQHDDVRSLQR